MSDGRDLYARVSFIPYLLALSLGVTWYAHHELFKGVDTWSFWTDFWGANRTQLEPRKWAKWTLAVLLFAGSFELFRRFDWFLRPTPGSPLPDSDEEDALPSEEEKRECAQVKPTIFAHCVDMTDAARINGTRWNSACIRSTASLNASGWQCSALRGAYRVSSMHVHRPVTGRKIEQ